MTAGRQAAALPGMAAAVVVLAFALLQAGAWAAAGVFEYPLDDVYIHLAMASGIARGEYGVNPGEPVAASSSILYPFLLAPFAGTAAQRLLPLVWNLGALAASGWLWGRIVQAGAAQAGFGPAAAALVAVGGALALDLHGLAFTGMENGLQVTAALATVLGLYRYLEDGRIAPWLVAALIVAPLIRYEGLALSLGGAALVWQGGRPGAAMALAVAILAPVVLFSAWLMWMGLGPLPGSVVAKAALIAPGAGWPLRIVLNLALNIRQWPGVLVAVLSGLALVVAGRRRGRMAGLPALAGLAGLAHLALGQFGWMDRYEIYILAVLAAALLLSAAGPAVRPARIGLIAMLAACLVFYQVRLGSRYVWNPEAIHLQQAQSARFVHDWLKAPVAVNDLGLMAWGAPAPVFDLWGLGSPEALRARLAGAGPGWAGPLLAARGVRVAVLYEKWFGDALGPGWQPVADLTETLRRGRLGDWRVTFYAFGPDAAADLRTKLLDFAPTLPDGAALTLRDRP